MGRQDWVSSISLSDGERLEFSEGMFTASLPAGRDIEVTLTLTNDNIANKLIVETFVYSGTDFIQS